MKYVSIKTTFWIDSDIEKMTPEDKLFYLYLLTNPKINQIGLFELSIRHAALETGFNTGTIQKLLKRMESLGKIKVSKTTKELLILKFFNHNKTKSEKLLNHCKSLINDVKDKKLIPYIYGIDTLSVPYNQEEEEKEEEERERG